MIKKHITILLAGLIAVLLDVSTFAAGDIHASGHDACKITVILNDPKTGAAISGAPVYIWKVADVSGFDANVSYDPVERFRDFFTEYFSENSEDLLEINLEGGLTSWDRFAESISAKYLPAVIDTQAIAADAAVLTRETSYNGMAAGTAEFTTDSSGDPLTPGLYLVRVPEFKVDTGHSIITYNFQTAFFLLPGGYIDEKGQIKENWEWDYSIEIEPKIEREEDPYDVETSPPETNPPETTPPETEPPETKPSETEPPETKPSETEPPETKPSETEPSETEPPETKPSETEPSETEPPETKPPETISPIFPPEETEPIEPAPETPPVENPPDDIPQTGMLWWPVPFMGVGGFLCIGIGSYLFKKVKDEQ